MSRIRRFNEGDRVGAWTIIEYPFKSRKALLRCDCGAEAWRFVSNFSTGASTRCKACSVRRVSEDRTGGYDDDWQAGRIYYLVKQGVKKDREFSLSIEDVWALSQSRCFYCNIEPSNIHKYAYGVIKYNGIDRIDSSRGYVQNNVRPACWKCNSAKKEMSDEEFMSWITKAYNHMTGVAYASDGSV